MSVLEASNDVQIWDNAAFDDSGGLERPSADMKASWTDLDRQCLNVAPDYDSSKENKNPLMGNSPPAPFKTPVSNTLLQPSNVVAEKITGSGKIGNKESAMQLPVPKGENDSALRDDAIIDLEIEQVVMEMSRLSLKLKALKLEKAEKKLRIGERRCSIVPAKYMEPKQSTNSKLGFPQKNKDSKPQRRGVSLCPAEIYSATKSRQAMSKPEISNSGVKQGSRRQSCFWKLDGIDELKVTKERGGKSASVSPKSRKPGPRFDTSKKAVTSIGSKKPMRKDVAVLSSVEPKNLFGERSAPPKKPFKSGRVVASRYNQSSTTTHNSSVDRLAKLRSSSENEGESAKKAETDKQRRDSIAGSESRVKKRWEIPAKGDVVVYKSDEESTPVIDEIADVLPRIRTVKCVNDTPRDSGAVKRVADLVGKKSFFGVGVEEEVGVCQALRFADEEGDGDQSCEH